MMNIEKIKGLAMQAQAEHIRRIMLANIEGDMRLIEKWDDFRYHLSFFGSFKSCFGSMSDSNVRYWMYKLVKAGIVEDYPGRRSYGVRRWRFPREVCDKLADEAVEHWKAAGYSQDEKRQAVKVGG